MHKRIIYRTTTFVFFVFGLTVFGCAHLTIPAPEAPVTPFVQPVLENSSINLPITVSLKSIADDLGQILPKGKAQDGSDQASILAGKIQGFLQRQASKIDNNNLAQNLFLQQQVGTAWTALQSPIKLSNGLFLLLNPQAAIISPQAEQSGAIKVIVGLVAKPKIVAGAVPPVAAQSLPALSISPASPEQGFHVALESELSYDFLSNELTKKLEGNEYSADGETIVVENARLYGSADAAVIAVRIKGSVKGVIYLTGVPAYDESTRTLFVKNATFTVETKQVLVKVADWLLHGKFQESLTRRAQWYIGDKIDAAKELLSSALNRTVNQHVSFRGKIDTLRPAAVEITAASIVAVLVAEGTVEMNVF